MLLGSYILHPHCICLQWVPVFILNILKKYGVIDLLCGFSKKYRACFLFSKKVNKGGKNILKRLLL
jgi:hypothetical protein